MLVYKNGSLTREGTTKMIYNFMNFNFVLAVSYIECVLPIFVLDVRDRCADKSWEVFNTFLQQTPPLNGLWISFRFSVYIYFSLFFPYTSL